MLDEKASLARALAKAARTAARVKDGIAYRTTGGRYDDMSESDLSWWTNGFYAGLLWLAWRETGEPELAAWARGSEERLEGAWAEYYGLHHDVGFMWQLSSVARYELLGPEAPDAASARLRGLRAADFLAGRFNPAGRFIRAWNEDKAGWAIIDCLMNLPLLYWAGAETGDPRYRHIAEAHSETVLRHFIRAEGSARHIVEFDPRTGAFLRAIGGQGYSEESAWTRGNAWALHGLALGARYTGRADFLATAELVAGYFLAHLPADKVPLADFKAPSAENVHRDASAGAIAASSLLLLAGLAPPERRGAYVEGARGILAGLEASCLAGAEDEALLTHGCVAYHDERPGMRDTSLIYADYFYLEALVRLNGGEGLF
jgi:unsaturated chondroitin disaccharide hydrolase